LNCPALVAGFLSLNSANGVGPSRLVAANLGNRDAYISPVCAGTQFQGTGVVWGGLLGRWSHGLTNLLEFNKIATAGGPKTRWVIVYQHSIAAQASEMIETQRRFPAGSPVGVRCAISRWARTVAHRIDDVVKRCFGA